MARRKNTNLSIKEMTTLVVFGIVVAPFIFLAEGLKSLHEQNMLVPIIGAGVVLLVIWLIVKSKRSAERLAQQHKYEKELDEYINMIDDAEVITDGSTMPFKLKRNEVPLLTIKASMGTYKKDGGVGYAMLQQRVSLWQGASFRIGGGRIAQTSSWQHDNHGTLYITNNRIVFDGETSNNSQLHTQILSIKPIGMGSGIYVDRMTGKDWAFSFEEGMSPSAMTTILAAPHIKEAKAA